MIWSWASFWIGVAAATAAIPWLISKGEKYKDVVLPYFMGKK